MLRLRSLEALEREEEARRQNTKQKLSQGLQKAVKTTQDQIKRSLKDSKGEKIYKAPK
jgi:hypothetical protein